MAHLCYIRISLATLAAFLLWNIAAVSQEPPCTTRKLPVSFRDAQNLPLENVSVTDLEAKMHGKPMKIVSLTADSRPHRIVLVLDISASMGNIEVGTALWNLELTLARHFFDINRQRTQIALLFFNNRVTGVIDFAQGNSAVGEKLRHVAADHDYIKTHIKGHTALRDAIFQAIQMLDHPCSADAVYVMTDGVDNASHKSADELDRRLAVTSMRLFAILLQNKLRFQGPNSTPEELYNPGDELSKIARKSGGEILTAAEWRGQHVALSANAEAKLKSEETMKRLYQAILQDNLLEIELPFPNSKNEHWELKLSEAARRKWKGAHITYPDTLISCDSEVAGSARH